MDADWLIPQRPAREAIVHDTAHIIFLSLPDALVGAGIDNQRFVGTEQQSSALIAAQHAQRLVGRCREAHGRTRHLETIARGARLRRGLCERRDGPAEDGDDRKHSTFHDGDPLALSVAFNSSTRLCARSRYWLCSNSFTMRSKYGSAAAGCWTATNDS